jgi:hypothetical protein
VHVHVRVRVHVHVHACGLARMWSWAASNPSVNSVLLDV